MKNPPPSARPRRHQGVALVLVLCFIVLITGLVVAYFSRTLTTRQLSSASTSTTSADLLAESATDVILGGLKQEIADPIASSTPSPTIAPPIYIPTQAKYAVPQRNPPATAGGSGDPIPNLVRRSMRADNLPAPGLASLASAASSTTTSANGHSVSLARWNRHYLIPTTAAAGGTVSISASAPVSDFTAPDWVFVTAEKGPVVLSGPKQAAGGSVTVNGRYAYAIYDEGGLLDINHTGYPSASTLAHIGAKPAPSFADLTQLGMIQPNVDTLLGWRNYATLQSTGSFPALQPPPGTATDTAYYNLFVNSPTSLLQVPLTLYNGKTDQSFLSRQQLINYFAATGLDPKNLQYFATFTRSLNQPSYAPEANRLPVLPSAQGGNNAGDSVSNSSTNISANFLTARVANAFSNPDLPSNPDTRYDGTPVVIGEPLVKKRFPLNRLAWLTYQGPSALRNTSATALTGPDADIGYLKQYGITKEWLDQGNADNIKLYFGLTYGANPNNADGTPSGGSGWTYVHNYGDSILNINNPNKSTDVVRQSPGREPDFFELLKAAINPGSIAKTSLSPNIINPSTLQTTHAAQDQYYLDDNLDRAILQIGANIIDQFDTDGYPTRINYNLGDAKAGRAVFGDENLPSISRVRSGLIRVAEANPPEIQLNPIDPVTGGLTKVKDTGVAALMNFPEIWNPHDWNPTTTPPSGSSLSPLAQSVGAVGPVKFKIYAATNTNNFLFREATVVTAWDTAHFDSGKYADAANSPGFVERGFQFTGETRTLTESNTLMTFTIDSADPISRANFREPTVLFTPGVPAGSLLAAPYLQFGQAGLGQIAANSSNTSFPPNSSFFSTQASGGLVSVVGASANGDGVPASKQAYVGFYLGAHPLRFARQGTPETNLSVYQTQFNPGYDVIFTLACQDATGAWVPYDTKELTTPGEPNGCLQTSVDSGFGLNGSETLAAENAAGGAEQGDLDYGLRYYQTIDPRTSRFGVLDPWIYRNTDSIPPRRGYSSSTSSPNQAALGTLKTDREGVNSGQTMNFIHLDGNFFNTNMGWYGCGNGQYDVFRPGMLTQNNPYARPDGVIAQGLPPDYTGVAGSPIFYSDADGVVRRASGGNVDLNGTSASTTTGLPMAFPVGSTDPGYSGTTASQMDSRPSILNRPFRSVAELGYVYSGTPWKNLDFFLPESGDSALLDVFCVNDNSDGNGLTAGQVNLNTHQVPVLQAILAQAAKDQWNDANVIPGGASAQAQQLAQLLVKRTVTAPTSGPNAGNGPQPLQNVSDLVGRWIKTAFLPTGGIDGSKSYDGFAQDLAAFLDATATSNQQMHNIQRFGESAVRALSNAGQTRVWNLMFDIVAQTGRFGTQATTLDQFTVEGEQHYWVHVAIDRYTGQILDKQVEVVKE